MKDLRIMWIDDSEEWYKSQKESLEVNLEDENISVDFEYCKNANKLTSTVLKQPRFEQYDLIFVDYSLSNNTVGDDIIKRIRENDIYVDIIFYSASKEKELIDKIRTNIELIDGITIANKDNFIEKAYKAICKIIQKQKSIYNMRGVLANITSENDYIINSYILENFDNLGDLEKEEIYKEFMNCQHNQLNYQAEFIKKYDEKGTISNINSFLKEITVPLEFKYLIFNKIAKCINDVNAQNFDVDSYFAKIVRVRNKLSHKKIEICKQGTYLKYYDNKKQYKERTCPADCLNHQDDNKISCAEWEIIKREAFASYTKLKKTINDVD